MEQEILARTRQEEASMTIGMNGLQDITYEASAVSPQSIDLMAKLGIGLFAGFLAELQVWGTPDEVASKLKDYQRMVGAAGIIGVFSFGGMPYDEAAKNMQLFADKVLPQLHDHQTDCDVGRAGPPTAEAATLSETRVTW